MTTCSLTIDDREVQAFAGQTLLEVCRANEIDVPVLCALDGLSAVGACRLCLLEIEGIPRLLPACTTPAGADQVVRTRSDKLLKYRRMILELFFAERNHVCAVCVANGDCELQTLASALGMDHVRFPYLFPKCEIDASHPQFVMDHNRCILCTRCVRVCAEVEGASVWDVMGRGHRSRIISDLNQPWGDSENCTACGKCVHACPTGALWPKNAVQGGLEKNPSLIAELVRKREVAR